MTNRLERGIAGGIAALAVLSAGARDGAVQLRPLQKPAITTLAPDAYYKILPGPCFPWPFPDVQKQQQVTQECLRASHGGTIALINYGGALSRDQAQTLAQTLPAEIQRETQGLVTMTATVVDASDKANKQLVANNKNGCIDSSNATNFASVAASETMPALKKYDFILALPSEAACTHIGGVADNGKGRDADIYPNPVANQEVAAKHEFFHLLNLGHAG